MSSLLILSSTKSLLLLKESVSLWLYTVFPVFPNRMALFVVRRAKICRSHRVICLLAVVATLNDAWPFETKLLPVKSSYAADNSRSPSNENNKQQLDQRTDDRIQPTQEHIPGGGSASGIPVEEEKNLNNLTPVQDGARDASVGGNGETEEGDEKERACSTQDNELIFWHKSMEDYKVVGPKRAQVLDGFLASVGESTPSNPFYEALLLCGRRALGNAGIFNICVEGKLQKLVQKQLSATCMQCFAESFHCGVRNCRGVCLIDSCSERCLACSTSYCGEDLLKCTGLDKLPPACLPDETSLFDEWQSTESGSPPLELWQKFYSLGVQKQ